MAFNAQAETLNDGTQVKIWRAAEAFLQAHHIHHAGDDRMRGIVDGVLAGLSRREIASLDPSSSLVMGLINNAAAPVINAINAPANKYGALPNGMIIGPDGKPVSIHDHNLRGHGRAAGGYASSADEDGGLGSYGGSGSRSRGELWADFDRKQYRGAGLTEGHMHTLHSAGVSGSDFRTLERIYTGRREDIIRGAEDIRQIGLRGSNHVRVAIDNPEVTNPLKQGDVAAARAAADKIKDPEKRARALKTIQDYEQKVKKDAEKAFGKDKAGLEAYKKELMEATNDPNKASMQQKLEAMKKKYENNQAVLEQLKSMTGMKKEVDRIETRERQAANSTLAVAAVETNRVRTMETSGSMGALAMLSAEGKEQKDQQTKPLSPAEDVSKPVQNTASQPQASSPPQAKAAQPQP